MHPGMQLSRVWFPGLPSQPGSFGAGAHTRAWRLRAQGDGGKLLGLPPRFPPFTAHLPLPLSLFFFLSLIVSAAAAGWFFSSPSNPASIFLIRVVLMPLSLSLFVEGLVDLTVLDSGELSPIFLLLFLPICER